MNVSQSLLKLKDEIQALKVTQPLNGGALTRHAATATWQGVIDRNAPISRYSMLAAFVLKYSRKDGLVKPPLVQFAYSLDPTDLASGAIIGIGQDDVSYKLVLPDTWWPTGNTQTTLTLTITAVAYSLVDGDLTITRVYS